MAANRTPRGASTHVRLLLLSKPDDTSGCRVWDAKTNRNGYGLITFGKKPFSAHRIAFETWVGPIPEGMTVDHLCFNRACVNPQHLQLLTPRENSSRQRKCFATHCKWGHEFTDDNTAWYSGGRGRPRRRRCLICNRAKSTGSTWRLAAEESVA